MAKIRGNKQDDEIFLKIVPLWNEVIDKHKIFPSGKELEEALNDACSKYGWTSEDYGQYQRQLRR